MKTIKIYEIIIEKKVEDMIKVKDILKLIDEIDIELLLTDIKDKQGNKYELSNEIMEIISIWWNKKSEELKQKIKGEKN